MSEQSARATGKGAAQRAIWRYEGGFVGHWIASDEVYLVILSGSAASWRCAVESSDNAVRDALCQCLAWHRHTAAFRGATAPMAADLHPRAFPP